jgi:uncharacterized protein (TIGR02246 family)
MRGCARFARDGNPDDSGATANRHDPKAMASIFSEDADMVDPSGKLTTGRAEIEKAISSEQTGIRAGCAVADRVQVLQRPLRHRERGLRLAPREGA